MSVETNFFLSKIESHLEIIATLLQSNISPKKQIIKNTEPAPAQKEYFKAKLIEGVHFIGTLKRGFHCFIADLGFVCGKEYHLRGRKFDMEHIDDYLCTFNSFADAVQADFERDRREAVETIRQFIVEHGQTVTLEWALNKYTYSISYDLAEEYFSCVWLRYQEVGNLSLCFKDLEFLTILIVNISPEHLALAYCGCRYADLVEVGK